MNINYLAPINKLGYGVVGTNIYNELIKNNNVSLFPIGPIECDDENSEKIRSGLINSSSFDYDAPSFRVWHQWDMGLNVGRGKKFGLTFFEMDRLKEKEIHNLNFLDKIFVCSEWAKKIIVDGGINADKVKVINLGVDNSIFNEKEVVPSKTTYLLNVGKWEIRKGHDLIIDILLKAFTPEDDFKLIMCCSNPFLSQEEQNEWIKFYETSPFFDKIIVLKNRLETQKEVFDIMKKSDIGIFPYRSEAWNLELAEMLALGKNCIATNYSGPTQYALESGCELVDPDGIELANDGKWFDGSGNWAKLNESYVEKFANKLKLLHQKKQSGELIKNTKGVEFFKKHTWESIASYISKEIK